MSALPFTPFNRTSEKEVAELLDASFEPLRKLTPGLGAYINEVRKQFPLQLTNQLTFSRPLPMRRILTQPSGETTTSDFLKSSVVLIPRMCSGALLALAMNGGRSVRMEDSARLTLRVFVTEIMTCQGC